MTENLAKPKRTRPARRPPFRSPIDTAPRQPDTPEAWKQFAGNLVAALRALEEDEYLILKVKGTRRFVQFMSQGAFGMRAESVSDFYLPEDDHLGQEDYHQLLRLGWHPPTQLPREFGHDFDGSPNYFLDLAQPAAVEDLAVMAVLTLIHVHTAGHPGHLEYRAQSCDEQSIRLPHLGLRRMAA